MAPPKPALCWPVKITAGVNDRIDFKVGATPYVATVAPATYDHVAYFTGEPTSSLAVAVTQALIAAYSTTWFVSVSASGRITIGNNSSVSFSIQWATGPNLARSIGLVLGYSLGADDGPATSILSDFQHQNGWYADDPVVDDSNDRVVYERAQTVALSGRAKGTTFATRYRRDIVLASLAAWKVWTEDEGGSHLNEALERILASGWARFRWFADQTDLATGVDYALDVDTAKGFPRNRLTTGTALYSLPLKLRKYV